MVLFIWVHVCLISSNFINWVCRWNPLVWNILAELLFKLSDSLRVEFSDGAYEIDDGDDEHDEDFDKYKSQRWRMNFMDTPQSKAVTLISM